MSTVVEVMRGSSPVILAFPHTGTFVPDEIEAQLNQNGMLLADTDWHLDRLYDGLFAGATIVRARFHRYVIDANRDPEGHSLYPGQNTTTLVPLTDFDGVPIWRAGEEPVDADIAARISAFHQPYHAALAAEVSRTKSEHGAAVLYDCHSIRSHIPFLFDGKLPDLNIGTNGGQTCAPAVQAAVVEVAKKAAGFSHVVNGRFRGGWTTRHFGRPEENVHAIQMELAQSAYLAGEVPPFDYDEVRARRLRDLLGPLLAVLEEVAYGLSASARVANERS